MTDALAVCLSPLLRMVSISTDYACIDDDERHELTTKLMMTLVAGRRRGIIPGHGLVADQTVPASAQLGRPASAVWLVQYCSALGLRLHA